MTFSCSWRQFQTPNYIGLRAMVIGFMAVDIVLQFCGMVNGSMHILFKVSYRIQAWHYSSQNRIFFAERNKNSTKLHLCRGPTLRSNGKCSNGNAIMDYDLVEYDLIG